METKGYVIIFGMLALVVGLIWGGAELHNGYGVAMMLAGAAVGIYWLFGLVLPILGALNSDI